MLLIQLVWVQMITSSEFEVHYNSNRLGVRLIGPKPQFARTNGGEGGAHPSNVHDHVYPLGTINFMGDMPVILCADGPSLGGFVCPATTILVWLATDMQPPLVTLYSGALTRMTRCW